MTQVTYVTALKGFGRWMHRERRVSDNIMLGLLKLNPKTDKRHPRRPFTVEEMHWLLSTTKATPARYGMTGIERALLYRVATETGFRANELRSLTRSSFRLDSNKPGITVQAGYSKRRRDDVLPLRADTVAELRVFLSAKLPMASVFNMPEKYDVVDMLRDDMADARQAWLADAATPQEHAERASTAFLCYVDAQGRFADFHALRHTTGTLLAASGAHPKVTQTIMRHSDINLTMSLYTHTLAGQKADAIENLPSLDVPPMNQQARKTGTDSALVRPVSSLLSPQKSLPTSLPVALCLLGKNCGDTEEEVFVGEEEKTNENPKENDDFQDKGITERGGTRTHDLRIKSALLITHRYRKIKNLRY